MQKAREVCVSFVSVDVSLVCFASVFFVVVSVTVVLFASNEFFPWKYSPAIQQTSETSTETKETQTSEEKTADDLSEQLQAIVNDYSKKMEEKTPVLIEEYQTEIQGNQEGIAGLSAVANQKARELQAISDEGIGKLRAHVTFRSLRRR